ncbi:GPP34 family phosphoprotein [Paractinoplanes rhizophilus]|uniref:GPP34 family phosphoprotein n=1 Tax=Paractinoplanes rhizophilus TaxID=1416877 RepID=A0ABW2HQG0_9ACTN|nr:GPP34 family phosphoprotein [Actinoplanes sp.]
MLADQYFLIAHQDRTGRSRLHPRATGLGLAAALLGELILEGRIGIADGDLVILDRHPPADSLTHDILDLLIAQQRHREVRTWLAFLSQDAEVRVGERLVRLGAVDLITRRRMLSTEVVYMPNSPEQRNAAAWAPARLANLLVRGIELSLTDRVLVGLVAATGLTRHVLYDFEMHRQAFQSLPSAVGALPGDLRDLIEFTEASVGSVLTVGRR